MDGMGEMDNAPLPPESAQAPEPSMDNEPMDDMNEPIGDNHDDGFDGNDDMNHDDGFDSHDDGFDSDDDMNHGDEPQDMHAPEDNGDDSELMDIIDNLSIEDKAAVVKYAKSMMNDESDDNGITQESYRNMRGLIDETFNDIINGEKYKTRDKKDLPKSYRKMNNPFKSPYA